MYCKKKDRLCLLRVVVGGGTEGRGSLAFGFPEQSNFFFFSIFFMNSMFLIVWLFWIVTKFCFELLLVIHDDNSFIFIVNPGLFSRVGVAELYKGTSVNQLQLIFSKISYLVLIFFQNILRYFSKIFLSPACASDSLVRFI